MIFLVNLFLASMLPAKEPSRFILPYSSFSDEVGRGNVSSVSSKGATLEGCCARPSPIRHRGPYRSPRQASGSERCDGRAFGRLGDAVSRFGAGNRRLRPRRARGHAHHSRRSSRPRSSDASAIRRCISSSLMWWSLSPNSMFSAQSCVDTARSSGRPWRYLWPAVAWS